MAIQFRNLSSSQAATYTPLAAEPIFNRDTGELLIGDGTTSGGIPVGGGGGSGYSGISGYSGAGSAITVKDEGTTLTSSATSLDFTGAGVTATNVGGAVTINIPGGGGGGATGATGISGFSGITGATGPNGATGISGFSGSGATGSSGVPGDRYSTTSSTSLAIASSGTITLTVGTGLAYSAAQSVIIANNGSNYMSGTVDTYNSGTGVMTVILSASTGSGTYTSWSINLAGAVGAVGATGPTGATGVGSPGATGLDANKYATVYLYQWATTQPGNPSGNSTYTWSSNANASYTGGNSWSTTVGSNPGGASIKLWVASKGINDLSSATTTSVDWSTGFSVYAYSENGAVGASGATGVSGFSGVPGLKTASVVVYKWSLPPAPSISGSSTYTWSTGGLSSVPTGWSAGTILTTVGSNSTTDQIQVNSTSALIENGGIIFTDTIGGLTAGQTYYVKTIVDGTDFTVSATPGGTLIQLTTTTVVTTATSIPIGGYTLWSATVRLQAASDAVTSTVDWTTAQILSISYAAANGSSSRIAYARIAGSPTPVSGTVTTSGDSSYPSGSATWGTAFNTTWSGSDPNPSSTDSLFQTYGVYDGTNTVWDTPFLASLRVGQLSAITTNTGTLTVNSGGYIQVDSGGYIKVGDNPTVTGSTMTGSGGVINGSTNGEFAFGNATKNISFNGTTLTVNGDLIATGNINTNAVTNGTSAYTAGTISAASDFTTWTEVQTITLTTTGGRVFVSYSNNSTLGEATITVDPFDGYALYPLLRLKIDGTEVLQTRNGALSYSSTPTAASHTYSVELKNDPSAGGSVTTAATVSNRSIFVLETKR